MRCSAGHSRGGCWFFFQAEDGIRDVAVTGVQTCALPILPRERLPGGVAVHRLPAQSEAPPQAGDRPRVNDFGLAGVLLPAYLIGATPTSYIAGRLGKGIHLRAPGSKKLCAPPQHPLLRRARGMPRR